MKSIRIVKGEKFTWVHKDPKQTYTAKAYNDYNIRIEEFLAAGVIKVIVNEKSIWEHFTNGELLSGGNI